ncbi:MAG: lamin tail domain-containing protein, partial [Candidatus Cloacimonetes bacterium]|nr:lamin tail domain-containing protein [Candidatus Cloacimonadota bacterium]
VAGSIFNVSNINKRLDSLYARLNNEWLYNSERWNYSKYGLSGGINTLKRLNETYNEFAYNNLSVNFGLGEPLKLLIMSNEESARLTFNGWDIPNLPYEGKYFKSKKLTIKAPEYVNGKEFQFWSITENGISREEDALSFSLFLKDSITIIKAIYDRADSVRRDGLYINEISASNAIYVDAQFKYEDWIEIYNASDKAINLAEYYISNDINNLELFQIKGTDSSKTTIPANKHSIIWCSKKPERGIMHTNFKLEKDGGSVFLSRKSKNGAVEIIDSLTYMPHPDYSSFGRYPDGDAGIYIFEKPTFKSTNIFTTYNSFQFIQNYNLVFGFNDNTIPVASEMYINNGKEKTLDSIVSISFKASKSAVYYRLSETHDFKNASWELLENETKFHLSSGFGIKKIYLQLKNSQYESEVISDEIEFVENDHKVVIGLSGGNNRNDTEIINNEMLNNVSLYFHDSYSAIQLYDVWGAPTVKLAKNDLETAKILNKKGISRVYKFLNNLNPSFSGDLGIYPDRFYSKASFFGASSPLAQENRRLIACFINVPNGTYDIRILASQSKKTDTLDYQSYRYQVNNSDIFTPSSDIFYNNQNNFIEFRNVKVEDSTLLVCSWREPFGVSWGYYAPMNLIEIKLSDISNSKHEELNTTLPINIFSAKGKLIIEKEELNPFTIYTIEGMIVKQVVPQYLKTEIKLPPGIYIICGQKAIVY